VIKINRTKLGLKVLYITLLMTVIEGVLFFIRTKTILDVYGPSTNGIVQIAIQLSTYLVLFESGLTAAYQFKMYTPYSEKDIRNLSSLYTGLKSNMERIALKMMVASLIISILYSVFLIDKQISYLDALSILLVISVRVVTPYYFLLSEKTLLFVAERSYLVTIVQGSALCIIMSLEIILAIYTNLPLALILSIYIVVNICLKSIYVHLVNRVYKSKVLRDASPDISPNKMTKDILTHQIASMVNNNTDNIILSIFNTLFNVTVYSSYMTIINYPINIFNKLISGMRASIAIKVQTDLESSFKVYNELLSFIIFSCSLIIPVFYLMANPFVDLWIGNSYLINDINRFLFSLLLLRGLIMPLVYSVRDAKGLFKETKNYTVAMTLTNILLSLLLVGRYGITGVLVATVISTYLISDLLNIFTVYKNIFRKRNTIIFHYLTIFICSVITIFIGKLFNNDSSHNWVNFIINSLEYVLISALVSYIILFLTNSNFRNLNRRLFKMVLIKKFKKSYIS
jgi:O-antigen/teichoic acid export membrane protein